jgi:hypothetical protein
MNRQKIAINTTCEQILKHNRQQHTQELFYLIYEIRIEKQVFELWQTT